MTATPVTQILYLRISPDRDLKPGAGGDAGDLWAKALDVIETSDGFQRVYWGRSLERAEEVQVHVGTWEF